MKNKIENYQLHAYLDGELTHDECLEIEQALKEDSHLRHKLEQFSLLKSNVKKAYLNLPIDTQYDDFEEAEQPPKGSFFNIAASLLMGVVIGASVITYGVQPEQTFTVAEQAQNKNKYLVHLDSDDVAKQQAALRKIEEIFVESSDHVQVDLVSNNTGIHILDSKNPVAQDLEKLIKKFDGLTVYACQRALERAQKEGKAIHLIPEAVFDRPAIDRLAERLNAGWGYIKI